MKKFIVAILLLAITGYGIWNALAAEKAKEVGLSVGNAAPDFSLQTLNGQTIHLSDFRGKPVIVNFWTTWCPPCKKEMPDMEKFYKAYHSDVELLAVHLTSQDTRENVKSFINEYQLSFPVVLDEKKKALELYHIQTIPTSYIIDKDGVIRKKIIGPMTYKQMVEITAAFRE
ncbi:redoxin domain-containing protein [Geobacillus sp. NFOSA3]|jgi:cytochrome c biogenesis protein CcmG, thiol:disulfide interchange protein DsbE|uniref:Peroxiredoxin n=2 Tax=Parageobacillus TaxID=1906945 RepID=A0A6G9J4W3_9BACL|nr:MULTISPECIES: redoxin domain-containing protein [Parageobacillus]NNU94266.1 redoxin domain-containing protein [Geobacillus sp. NFOSA3]OQP00358.1 thiol:disulfide interchange protein [Geobacillus sp. 44C]MBB3869972.1 peroxiredoxin [Parageobacillus toebii NBRC 107807]MED4990713.1 redoxin domain-containing protein [Parageobacillus toebii]OXB91984.1 thiol:disulfide interchange protein [Parageobacillus galactosidasius]